MKRSSILLVSVVLVLSGCGSMLKTRTAGSEPIVRMSGIAVLPFENVSGQEGASEKVTEYVQQALESEQVFRLIAFGQVYEQMRRLRIRSAALLTYEQMDSLSSSLNCRYLFTGSVLEFRETDNQYLGKIPQLSINLRLVDCKSHEAVWIGTANARGNSRELLFGVGVMRSLETLTKKITSKAARILKSKSKN